MLRDSYEFLKGSITSFMWHSKNISKQGFLKPLQCLDYTQVPPWAVGDYCISLKVLKSPHKEIYSFKLTMLWLSLSSSLSSAKYFHLCSMHTTTVAMWASAPSCIDSTHRGTVLNQCNMAQAPTRPQLWCAYCIGGNIWQKTMKKKETTTAS